MPLPRHPLRPLVSALRAWPQAARRIEIWIPFLALAALKAILLTGAARLDLIPTFLLAPLVSLRPGLERFLHYPDMLLRLPRIAQALELTLFLSVGALAQGWAIARLARAWGNNIQPPRAAARTARAFSLMMLAALLVVVPFGVARLVTWAGFRHAAPIAALATGTLATILLFVAPAFVVLHGLSLGRAISASARMLARLPFAVPLAVLLVSVLHAPGLFLRTPAIRAGAASDPDWVLGALLAQLPAEVIGAALSAGLATYFALRTGASRRRPTRGFATLAAGLLLLFGCGCDSESAHSLRLRYGSERCLERARLREHELEQQSAPGDSTAWIEVADLYGQALDRLGMQRLTRRNDSPLQADLGRLACKGLLGRAEALVQADRCDAARHLYRAMLEVREPYRGAQGEAALGLARCEEHDGRWNAAHAAYQSWAEGVRAGQWPLHRDGLQVPVYVARRLRDRGDREACETWIDLASAALLAASERGELERDACTACFGLLVGAERWDAAYATLHRLRETLRGEDPSGALRIAEASLLAGGLGREREALGILSGLRAEKSPFDLQHRVAGFLLLGQIHFKHANWSDAESAFQQAAEAARSESARSEATLGLARVHAARGEVEEARRLYTQLRDVYPATPAGLLAPIEEMRMLRERGLETEARGLVPVAIASYRAVMHEFGYELPTILAARYLSDCMGFAGDWEGSVAVLDSVATAFGNDPRAGSLVVRAARLAATQLEDRERAGALLATLSARYPDSDVAVLAREFADSLGVQTSMP